MDLNKENRFEEDLTSKPNDVDEDDDEEEDDDLDEVKEMKARHVYSRQISSCTRRLSVFSKTYDPEDDENANSDTNSNKNNLSSDEEEEDEIIQNRHYEKQSINKTNEQKAKLHKIISSIIIFKNLYPEEISELIEEMFERKCNQNDEIIKEGDNGNYFYVISSGCYEAYIRNSSNDLNDSKYGRKVREYDDSGYFGELALLYDQPRLATVVCSKDNSVLYCMRRDKFKRLVIGSAFKRRKMYQDFLESVTLLKSSMNDYERSQVADALKTITYKNGDIIFHQNDIDANGMFFVEHGKVEIKRNINGKEVLLKVLGVGEYFGELALVNKAPRSATAYIFNNGNNDSLPCKLAFLDLDAFERLMGPCIELIKSNMTVYKDLNQDITGT